MNTIGRGTYGISFSEGEELMQDVEPVVEHLSEYSFPWHACAHMQGLSFARDCNFKRDLIFFKVPYLGHETCWHVWNL